MWKDIGENSAILIKHTEIRINDISLKQQSSHTELPALPDVKNLKINF